MSRDGARRFSGETQPHPTAGDTQNLFAIGGGDTLSIDAGVHNVEQLHMPHLQIFTDMKMSLTQYIANHTGRFGSLRRDETPKIVDTFETYIRDYYIALHQYESQTVVEPGDPRAHQFNFSALEQELKTIIKGVIRDVTEELKRKQYPPTQQDIDQRVSLFEQALEPRIAHIISQIKK